MGSARYVCVAVVGRIKFVRVPHTAHDPRCARLPFFIVTRSGSFCSVFCLHLTQYTRSATSSPPFAPFHLFEDASTLAKCYSSSSSSFSRPLYIREYTPFYGFVSLDPRQLEKAATLLFTAYSICSKITAQMPHYGMVHSVFGIAVPSKESMPK